MTTHNLKVISIVSSTVLRNGRATTTRPTCTAIDDDLTLNWVADWDHVPRLLDVITITFSPQTTETK